MKIKSLLKKGVSHLIQIGSFISELVKFQRRRGSESGEVAFMFRISSWKQPYMQAFLPEYKIIFVPKFIKIHIWFWIVSKIQRKVFISWGYNDKEDKHSRQIANKYKIPFFRIEDGFVRSVGLGSMLTPPYSICLDKKGMYFDSSKESDLEYLLNCYDFKSDKALMDETNRVIEKFKILEVSKYNHVGNKNIQDFYGDKFAKRILVIGQVENDASIRKGSKREWTNNDVVRLARKENPNAEIFYKPHPDVLTGRRAIKSHPDEIKDIAKVIKQPISLVNSLETIDHVYTITSLSGFEALIRGIKVTTLGAPFYSGWGLTDDRQQVSRRKQKLSIEELFAGAYILYPKYIDPRNGEQITLEDTIDRIVQEQEMMNIRK